ACCGQGQGEARRRTNRAAHNRAGLCSGKMGRSHRPAAGGTEVYADMEQWAEIRRRVLTGELSKRAACRQYDIHWLTLKKILSHEEPPGYRRTKPPPRAEIDPVPPVNPPILADATRAP